MPTLHIRVSMYLSVLVGPHLITLPQCLSLMGHKMAQGTDKMARRGWVRGHSLNQSINVTPKAMKLKKLMPAIH
jgi:hypothetical protein